jgi:hypothetical protein
MNMCISYTRIPSTESKRIYVVVTKEWDEVEDASRCSANFPLSRGVAGQHIPPSNIRPAITIPKQLHLQIFMLITAFI